MTPLSIMLRIKMLNAILLNDLAPILLYCNIITTIMMLSIMPHIEMLCVIVEWLGTNTSLLRYKNHHNDTEHNATYQNA